MKVNDGVHNIDDNHWHGEIPSLIVEKFANSMKFDTKVA